MCQHIAAGMQSTRICNQMTRSQSYDMHGWLKEWNTPFVSQQLRYADGANPSYSGRVSAKITGSYGSSDRYDYSYDRLGRLISADFSREMPPNIASKDGDADYSTTYSYDFAARYLNASYPIFSTCDLLQEIYCPSSPYLFCGGDPINFIDPTGMIVKGVSRISSMRVLDELHNTFPGKECESLRALFRLESDGLTVARIDRQEFLSAISGLNSDQQALAWLYYSAINDNHTFIIDMCKQSEPLSQVVINNVKIVNDYNCKTGADFDRITGGVASLGKITIALIIIDSKSPVSYVYKSNGVQYSRYSTPAEIMAHEVLGHGLSFVKGSQTYNFKDAIQITNLYWRVRGYTNFYRDGRDHSKKKGEAPLPYSQANSIPPYINKIKTEQK